MIRFACNCGQKFDLPDSQAGDEFQCPRCMSLVSVPQLSDLPNLAEDGTFKMYEIGPARSELADKLRTFSFADDQRTGVDAFLSIGTGPEDAPPIPRGHGPRYDPETGERILPVDLREEPEIDLPQAIPMAAPVLGYSTGPAAPDVAATLAWWQMPWRLMSGMNLFAIGFVFLAHLIVQGILALPGANFLLSPFVLFLVPLIMAHYCNTMEDFGANHRDRVPVMFRNGSVSEDLFRPLVYIFVSALIAFSPLIATLILAAKFSFAGADVLANVFFWLGLFSFPAVIFTGLNSGAMNNLTPRRILSVVRVAPMRYLWAATAFTAAIVAYLLALQHYVVAPVSALSRGAGPVKLGGFFVNFGIAIALQAAAIYLMHLAAAWMGLIYQSHYEKFNWVLQRHVKADRTDTNAKLADLRRRGDPRVRPVKQAPATPPPPRAVLPIEPTRPSARVTP